MSLAIPNYQDPQDADGVIMPGATGWVPDLRISYADRRASLGFWVHRSAAAAASWPTGTRIRPAKEITITCGDPVPGHPDVVFPELDALMAGAAAEAIARMTALGLVLNEEQAAALADIATGGSIRKSLYTNVNELVFPDAVEVE